MSCFVAIGIEVHTHLQDHYRLLILAAFDGTHIIRRHCSRLLRSTYVDSAYCYRPIVIDQVAWSVCRLACLSVTLVSPAKTAEPIEMPFGVWTQVGQRKHVRWDPSPWQREIIRGKDMPGYARRHSAMSCAKLAKSIDFPFGLWTQVGRIKKKFNRIRQVAPMCPHWRAHWRNLENTIESSVCGAMQPYVKLL